jgi:hypothetical protein
LRGIKFGAADISDWQFNLKPHGCWFWNITQGWILNHHPWILIFGSYCFNSRFHCLRILEILLE